MNLHCLYGFVALTTFGLCHAHHTYSNGWIPLTAEEVYSKMKVNHKNHKEKMLKIPNEEIDQTFAESEDANIHSIRSMAIKIVKPEIKLQIGKDYVLDPIEPDTIQSVNDLQNTFEESHDCENSQENEAKFVEKSQKEEPKTDSQTRQSKSINVGGVDDKANKLIIDIAKLNEGDTGDIKRRYTKDVIVLDGNRYEVTEDPIEILEQEEESSGTTSGYIYGPPNVNLHNLQQNNITHSLLEILSKHNIKPEDDLPNYTLSRKIKAQDPTNAFMFIPVPLRVLPQFNNLKQLSVDPLLAVLMSNYGYYFPGSYGIHSRYRNLYGHLASNNIHNNKPFGSYKIFSDTDSSN